MYRLILITSSSQYQFAPSGSHVGYSLATSPLDQQRIESIVHQTVESTLRRLARPPEGNLRTGFSSVDTRIQTGDSRSKLRYCLKTIKEEYGISNFRDVYFRSLKEYVIRRSHGNQFPSDNHIISYIRTT